MPWLCLLSTAVLKALELPPGCACIRALGVGGRDGGDQAACGRSHYSGSASTLPGSEGTAQKRNFQCCDLESPRRLAQVPKRVREPLLHNCFEALLADKPGSERSLSW